MGQHARRGPGAEGSCAHYPYRYVIDPPTDDWAAEIFLVGPKGGPHRERGARRQLRSRDGHRHWRLCRPSLTPGRYKIRMKITYLVDHYDKYEGFVKPSYFRLKRR